MSEQTCYPESMRVKEAFRWTKNFYPRFDGDFAKKLADSFELDINARIKGLSTGYLSILKLLRDRFHLEAPWEAFCRCLEWLSGVAFGAVPNCMVSCLAVFGVFSAFSWLLIRRVSLKK